MISVDKSWFAFLIGYNCTSLPVSMNGKKHKKGCPGAVYSHGGPAWGYCVGDGGKYPWWKMCCKWTHQGCVPKGIVQNHCRFKSK